MTEQKVSCHEYKKYKTLQAWLLNAHYQLSWCTLVCSPYCARGTESVMLPLTLEYYSRSSYWTSSTGTWKHETGSVWKYESKRGLIATALLVIGTAVMANDGQNQGSCTRPLSLLAGPWPQESCSKQFWCHWGAGNLEKGYFLFISAISYSIAVNHWRLQLLQYSHAQEKPRKTEENPERYRVHGQSWGGSLVSWLYCSSCSCSQIEAWKTSTT